ncbi:hypothetical protein CONCODRAFT_133205 [Conidiobolus coronatus NRRL 28638]|uniref:Uncharacterized protein n=1 Tax=Conidiobolus coronatus (strain ATCC 28846 / CBS 209.66 / NRRL 28638) TaxID=796925 RepID=A0A137NTI2_CONC2|nr:hypothetical protein CONCODRAFT_133205 [Conidiobolus coronatus NRRL 28638]|eukprot:KXN66052.1 hypothetical protein CONCODRAFT_133205 [Conidiobolus coronatus NRRL 28638]
MKFLISASLLSLALAAPSFDNLNANEPVLARRGNSIGSGDEGGHVNDESHSTSVNAGGDAAFSGTDNSLSAVKNIFLGPTHDALFRRGIIQGLGILGGNGNGNEDSSQNNNVIAHNNQQLSGQNINNSPVLNTGDVNTNMSVQA